MGSSKEISGEKLTALRNYLAVLADYFPFGLNGKKLLKQINSMAQNSQVLQGNEIGKLFKEAEAESRQVFSTPQKWLGKYIQSIQDGMGSFCAYTK